MHKITIVPRPLSYGERQALKRLIAFTKSKEAKIDQRKGNGITAIIKPPQTSYGSLNLAPDNDV